MNIMQHIKDFFADAKKRNIFISCAAAVVIIAVAVPVGLALRKQHFSGLVGYFFPGENRRGFFNASASQGSGLPAKRILLPNRAKKIPVTKTSSGDKRITVPVLLQKLRGIL